MALATIGAAFLHPSRESASWRRPPRRFARSATGVERRAYWGGLPRVGIDRWCLRRHRSRECVPTFQGIDRERRCGTNKRLRRVSPADPLFFPFGPPMPCAAGSSYYGMHIKRLREAGMFFFHEKYGRCSGACFQSPSDRHNIIAPKAHFQFGHGSDR